MTETAVFQNKINTILIENNVNFRELIQILLERYEQINIIGIFETVSQAIEELHTSSPHIVIVDLHRENEQHLPHIHSRYPQAHIIATGLLSQSYEITILNRGYDAYIDKTNIAGEIYPTMQMLFNTRKSNGNNAVRG